MMTMAEIDDAVARDDTPGIEAAFRALVDYPGGVGIAGVRSVDALCRILERVSRGLRRDEGVMPVATGEAIAAALGQPVGDGATYAVGARLVTDHLYHWRGVYLQHALNTGTA